MLFAILLETWFFLKVVSLLSSCELLSDATPFYCVKILGKYVNGSLVAYFGHLTAQDHHGIMKHGFTDSNFLDFKKSELVDTLIYGYLYRFI